MQHGFDVLPGLQMWHTAQGLIRICAVGLSRRYHIRTGFLQKLRRGEEFLRDCSCVVAHFDGDDEASSGEFARQISRAFRDKGVIVAVGFQNLDFGQRQRGLSSAFRMAAMCSGVVPQQPR